MPIEPTRVTWANETQKVFAQLQKLKIEALLVQPVPEFTSDVRYEVSILKQPVNGEDQIVLNRGNEFLNQMDKNAVKKVFDDRSVLNLYRQFCTSDLCSRVIDGKFMYEDSTHLSSLGSMFIAPALEQALKLLVQN